MNNTDNKTKLIVATAMLTALTTLATTFLKIPLPVGYIHLGDTVVVLAALTLPLGYACFAGGVGCALADILGGYAAWAPWSLLAKVAMVISVMLMSRRALSKTEVSAAGKTIMVLGFVLAATLNIAVYYIAEGYMYGNWIAPAVGIPTNALQSIAGIALAVIINKMLPKNIM